VKPSSAVWLLLALAAPASAAAQGVLVAPTAVFIDARARTASLMIANPNDQTAEVEIATFFGYPVSDSAGQLILRTVDAPDSTMPSAAAWVKPFPRRMSLAPNAQQTVRLLVTPPPGLPDGEYWARLMITAKGGQLPITQPGDTGGVHVGLSVEVRTVLPLLYRKGKLQTAVTMSDLRTEHRGDSLLVRARIERTGRATALGTARGELADSTGVVRATFSAPVSAYYAVDPRFAFALDSVPPGRYRVRIELAPGRQDLAPDVIIPFTTVRDSATVQLP
jgi:P pilus assembly chaperone PapD